MAEDMDKVTRIMARLVKQKPEPQKAMPRKDNARAQAQRVRREQKKSVKK